MALISYIYPLQKNDNKQKIHRNVNKTTNNWVCPIDHMLYVTYYDGQKQWVVFGVYIYQSFDPTYININDLECLFMLCSDVILLVNYCILQRHKGNCFVTLYK